MNIKFVNLLKTVLNNHKLVTVTRKGNRGMVINLDKDAEVEIDLQHVYIPDVRAPKKIHGGIVVTVNVDGNRAIEIFREENRAEYDKAFGSEVPELIQNLTTEQVAEAKRLLATVVGEIAIEAAIQQML